MSPSASQHQQQQQRASQDMSVRLAKTEMCRYYRTGCRNGVSCPFAHNKSELRQRPDFKKTALCKMLAQGQCSKAAGECTYAHCEEELRKRARRPQTRRPEPPRQEASKRNCHIPLMAPEESGTEGSEIHSTPASTRPASSAESTSQDGSASSDFSRWCDAGLDREQPAKGQFEKLVQPPHWPEEVLPLLFYLMPQTVGIVDREQTTKLLLQNIPDCYEE